MPPMLIQKHHFWKREYHFMPMAMTTVTNPHMMRTLRKSATGCCANQRAASFKPAMPSSGVKKSWRNMSE